MQLQNISRIEWDSFLSTNLGDSCMHQNSWLSATNLDHLRLRSYPRSWCQWWWIWLAYNDGVRAGHLYRYAPLSKISGVDGDHETLWANVGRQTELIAKIIRWSIPDWWIPGFQWYGLRPDEEVVLPRGESSRIEVGNLGYLETVRHYELKRSVDLVCLANLVTSSEFCGPVVQPIRSQDGFTRPAKSCLYEEQIEIINVLTIITINLPRVCEQLVELGKFSSSYQLINRWESQVRKLCSPAHQLLIY